ncbi:chemotaxis protein histidine kinase CheA [Bradyrhizobium sp. GM24.11]
MYGSLGGDDVPLVPAKPVVAGPQANPDSEIRRDYELALQLGTRDGWTAFLNRFPSGFYTDLAKGQLNKIAAEETRAAAAEKARQAEDEKARLASDRAKKAEQEKAAAAAKAAEDAKAAAEKAKQIEEAKAAAAERRRKDAEAAVAKAVADKQAAEKALADKIANDKVAAEMQAAEKQQAADSAQKVAALAPTSSQPSLSPAETAKLVQSELRRVGCLAAAADGDWNASSQRSLTLFNKYAGTKFDAKQASFDALDTIKAKPGRVCPLVCDHGFKADGDTCVKIACRAGYRVNDDNECGKVQDKKPVATREDAKKRDTERKQTEAAPTKPSASGQMICNNAGCRPVRPGCHIGVQKYGSAVSMVGGGQAEVCD